MKRLALSIVVVLALVGCVAIPDSGPVVEGQVDTTEQSNDLVFIAPEPQEDATQEEIILGFLAAAISPDNNFSIARQYLTDGAATTWNPNARVIVRTGPQPEVSLTGDETATVSMAALSEVDAGGALQLTGGDRMLEFELAQVAGEWRIARAPGGIVLSAHRFDQLFQPHQLHWLTPDGTRSVPEVRWFERTRTTLHERIVDALLGGPSTWLSPAVSTFGAVEAHRVGQLQIDGAVTTVTLSYAQVAQLGPGSLEPLAAQLALSLRGLGVREVRVQVEGLSGATASSESAHPVDEGSVDQRPLVLEGSVLRSIGGGTQTVVDVGGILAGIGATSFTVGADGGVAHTGTTATWILPEAEPVVISTDAAIVPTVDDSGWVLLQERASSQRLVAWRDGQRAELALPADMQQLSAIELSRDGTRLALVTSQNGSSVVWTLAVVRDADGRPMAFGEPYRLPVIDGAATDITWVSSTQVAVLGTDDDAAQVAVLDVGGLAEQLPAPGVPVESIVGGSEGVSTLRALASDGSLLSLRGQVWSAANGLEPLRLIATQQ